MKYLLNLPLAVAALLQVWFASLVFMSGPWSGWSDGLSRGAMVLVMLEPVALVWILLLPVIAGSVFADAFDWLPVRRRWLQLTLVLGASVLIGILVIPCVLVAIGESAAVGQSEDKHFGPVLIGGATIAATVVPLIVMAWLVWLIDAPPLQRHATLPRRISLTALVFLALIGGVLGADMLREEIAVTRETAARYQRMDDERTAMTRAGFAKLTDADALRNWVSYTDRFTPDDTRQAAGCDAMCPGRGGAARSPACPARLYRREKQVLFAGSMAGPSCRSCQAVGPVRMCGLFFGIRNGPEAKLDELRERVANAGRASDEQIAARAAISTNKSPTRSILTIMSLCRGSGDQSAARKVRLIDSGERTQIGAQLIAVGPRQKVFDGGVRVPPYRNGRDEKGPSGRGQF